MSHFKENGEIVEIVEIMLRIRINCNRNSNMSKLVRLR